MPNGLLQIIFRVTEIFILPYNRKPKTNLPENIFCRFCRCFNFMSYVCVIFPRLMTFHKTSDFDTDLQTIAKVARVLSHPARLAILRYLAQTNTCISGDISNEIPLSRTTVSQHLQELRSLGLIHGEIEGVKVNYCICGEAIREYIQLFSSFFKEIDTGDTGCCGSKKT